MFRGQFRHTIDTKGRVSIPAKFREAEAGIAGDKLVIVPNGVALEVHPFQKWEELEQRLSALPRFDQDAREIRHRYLSLGQDVSLDAHGRIQVPQDYRERVGLRKDVLVVGMQEYFEVWDVERWEHAQRDPARPLDELFKKLADKGV